MVELLSVQLITLYGRINFLYPTSVAQVNAVVKVTISTCSCAYKHTFSINMPIK